MYEGNVSNKMAECFNVQQQIQLRYLCPDDLLEVKRLCADWFPIQYPESWYFDILTNPRFYSLAATIDLKIIGMIVSEVKPKSRCNREDMDILAAYYPGNTLVAYILSLGVVKQYRRHGIASLLLDSLLSYLTSEDLVDCKVVYLHVLKTNSVAIKFYEKRNFRIHASLPCYYSIEGKLYDGYSYVLYVNDGKPPSTLFDCCKYVGGYLTKLKPCAFSMNFLHTIRSVWRYAVNQIIAVSFRVH